MSNGRPLSERIVWAVLPPTIRGVGRVAWRLQLQVPDGLPEPPFVVASNHFSFLDGLLIGAVLRQKVRFLALVDLFGNYRWLDFALNAFDVIPIKRGVVPLSSVRAALSHLNNGGAVGLFPEGTRHHTFDPLLARPGAGWLAARAGVPLVPVAVAGTNRVLGVDNRLRAGRICVTIGRPLSANGTDRNAVDELMTRWAIWVSKTLDPL
jgi:1-acyl-sn-glycerol-3-phosphate acyltransferase